jgi:hypothetical protein
MVGLVKRICFQFFLQQSQEEKLRNFGHTQNKPLVPLQFDLPRVGQKEWGLKAKKTWDYWEEIHENMWIFGNNMDKCRVRTGRHKAKELSLAPKFLELPHFEVLTCVVQFFLCKRTSRTNSNFLLQKKLKEPIITHFLILQK